MSAREAVAYAIILLALAAAFMIWRRSARLRRRREHPRTRIDLVGGDEE